MQDVYKSYEQEEAHGQASCLMRSSQITNGQTGALH